MKRFFTCSGIALPICVSLTILSVLPFANTLHADSDWPQWRGPTGDGISRDADLKPAALAARPIILWKANVDRGFSSMSIKGDRVYTMGNNGKEDIVYCLDIKTGREVWRYSYACRLGQYPGPRATPAVDEGKVYTLSKEGHLFCLNAKNGKVVWKVHLGKDLGVTSPTWGFAGSPVIEGDLLILNAGVSGIALEKKSGEKQWSSRRGTGGYAAPVLYDFNGSRYAAIFGESALYGVEVKTGKTAWSYPWRTSYDVNAADPLIAGNRVFISSNYGSGCAMLEIKDKKPRLLWKNNKFNSHFSSFIFIDGYIYGNDGTAWSDAGVFRCIEADSGKEMWATDLGFGSLIAVQDKLIMLNSKGDLFIAQATPESYAELARAKNLLSRKCWTPPAYARGLIFLRNDRGEIVCVDVSK